MSYILFFFQAEDGIRDAHYCLEFRRVLFRSAASSASSSAGTARALRAVSTSTGSRNSRAGTAPSARASSSRTKGGLSGPGAGMETGMAVSLLDRKRVVSGRRVSVRVDLGGRRILKKKTNINRRATINKY